MPLKRLHVVVTRRLPDPVETRLKELFDAAGISIPYPQQDVHFVPVDGPKPAPVPAIEKQPASKKASISEGDEGH